MAAIPLYQDDRIPSRFPAEQGGHPGLWFERFFNQYDRQFSLEDSAAKAEFLKTLCNPQRGALRVGDPDALRVAWVRQQQRLAASGGEQRVYSSDWYFVTGLGSAHPVENALLFHPTLGVPYLPGSGVKGMVRAWIEQHLPEPQAALRRIFGSESKDPAENSADFEAGEVLFFDALPIEPVELVIDTMTPHMGKWYEQGGERPGQPDTVPADWHDPVPVPFLAVKQVSLAFAIAPRHITDDTDDLLALVQQALASALRHAGAGAKTAAGYGSFGPANAAAEETLGRWHKDLAEATAEHQREAELAALSPSQQVLAKLAKEMDQPNNQNPSSGGEFHSALLDQVKNAATQWPADDFAELTALVQAFFKAHGSKARRKAYSQLKRELGVE